MIDRRLPWLLAIVLLSGCRVVPTAPTGAEGAQEAYLARADELSTWKAWELVGRLSIDDGEDGGSGRLAWRLEGEDSRLDFRGALGQGAWRLEISTGRAVLERADGSRTMAPDVESLVWRELGWRLPVNSLRYWVMGLQAPGRAERLDLDEQGRVTYLVQQGWSIELDRYRAAGGVDLPGRIEATDGALRIKLIAASWARLPPELQGA